GSGQSSDIWHFNTFVGTNAGYNSNMSDNTFVGYAAGYSNVDGACNAILGDFASAFNVSGDHNSIFGHGAGINLIAGNDNTFMGYWAGMGTSGSNSYYNCFFGSEAGKDVSGNSNVMLGRQSGLLNQTGSGNVFVGNQAGYQETGSNKLYISNSTTATPLIYGDFLFNNRYLRINGENLWINNIEASTTNLTIDGNDGYIKQLRFYEAGAYKAGFGWSGSSDYIFLYEGGTNSFSSKGGLIGIRTVSPQAYLHVGLAGEVNATEGGGFILGPTASYNLSMDENEIQARNGTGVASLYLNNYGGNVYAGGTFLGSSDLRLKKDIADVSYGLKDVLKMRSVSFNWKNTKNQHKSMGFIAQELESIFPELVFDDEKGMKSVNYDGIIPILVNSIKEQQNRIEELENDIEEIKKLLIK
ncbi:MAG: tail fiber domain-containing protein, partial [Candidatus Delongbacteria bacterium]|nr:tail fiber domain-containing protein [Candidatus Delongbacteria bacterium]